MSNVETWKTWEGKVVDGKFPLRQWLGGSEHSAVFLTERLEQAAQKAAIKLIAADGEAQAQLARWRAAVQLAHPHLIRIYESGRSQISGATVLYVVMEFAEEDLSQILPQRPLAPAEVTDLLPPLLDALTYLHEKGSVHGRIKPSNVLAVGDLLKLSSDRAGSASELSGGAKRRDVYDAPETAAGIVLPAGDLWSVGATLVEALTQHAPFADAASQTDRGVPASIPEPFRGIARECLHLDPKRRCSIAEIQARLQPAARTVPAAAATPAPVQARGLPRRMFVPFAAVVVLLAGFVAVSKIFSAKHSNQAEKSVPSVAAEQPRAAAPEPAKPTPPKSTLPKPTAASPAVRAADPPKRAAATATGEVVHQVVPDVPRSARNTITGTIKVGVQVEVDASGKVKAAKLKSAGPSQYFAKLALRAAQDWQFSPESNGQAANTWLLQFRFTRGGTEVSPQRLSR